MKRYISPKMQAMDLHTESAILGLSGYEAGGRKETEEILTNKKGISNDYNSSLWSQMDNNGTN